jgi:hypothetical protein
VEQLDQFFQYISIITGLLVLIVGFGFHWIGQFISVVNRDLAIRIGIWEKDNLPEYEVYENAMAIADVLIGWTYGIAGAALILGSSWGYKLAWIPGVILLYHSLSFWFWTANQEKAGHVTAFTKNPARTAWFLANFVTGVLAISVAWVGG